MDFDEFRCFANDAVELIIKYLQNIRDRDVLPTIKPSSIINALPNEIPEKPEHWKEVLYDLETIILPGLTHWQSPHFHAFFPSASSPGSIVGELLISGIGVLGFNWVS